MLSLVQKARKSLHPIRLVTLLIFPIQTSVFIINHFDLVLIFDRMSKKRPREETEALTDLDDSSVADPENAKRICKDDPIHRDLQQSASFICSK